MLCLFIVCVVVLLSHFFFFKQKTAYEMRISDWSSDVCSSDLDADTPLLLVGTSYSANSKWGFEAQIKHAARVDLVNAAAEGQGPFKPVAALDRKSVV